MKDPVEMFRAVFDNSDIVKRWEAKGFDHVGTIFCGNEYDIRFPKNSGIIIEPNTYLSNIEIDIDMLNLIYETKQYIVNLDATCNALCSKID